MLVIVFCTESYSLSDYTWLLKYCKSQTQLTYCSQDVVNVTVKPFLMGHPQGNERWLPNSGWCTLKMFSIALTP